MTRAHWQRLAGLLALSTLALHGVGALSQLHAPPAGDALTHFQHVLALQPEALLVDLPGLVAIGRLVDEPAAVVAEARPRLVFSRGPPV